MKQIIASVFFDILSYTIGNVIVCIFKNFELSLIIITARVDKLRLSEVNGGKRVHIRSDYTHIVTPAE